MPVQPVFIGFEALGVGEDVGEGVSIFRFGDRVAYAIPTLGSYAEIRNYRVDKPLPATGQFGR